MSPFEPAGERARWRELYDLLTATAPGEIVKYDAMAAATGLDPYQDRAKLQAAMRRAARELLYKDLKSVEAVRNAGYQVVQTGQKLELAKMHQGKGRRSIRRAGDHVRYVDMEGMDPGTRDMFLLMADRFARQDEIIRRLDVRQARQERQVREITVKHMHTEEQLADLQARLARLEQDR